MRNEMYFKIINILSSCKILKNECCAVLEIVQIEKWLHVTVSFCPPIPVPTRVVLDLNVNTMITMIILFAMKLAKTQRVVKRFPKQLFWVLNIKTKSNIRKAFKVKLIKKKLMLETKTLNYPPTHEKEKKQNGSIKW